MMREDDSRSNRTNTRTGGSFRRNSIAMGNVNTLRGKHARFDTAAQGVVFTRRNSGAGSTEMRIATAGPGW